ncbi:MAG: winged helix-turn-helix transcriptional regulator [Bacteroidales bacterium]|jgi:predicted transcriptional regulator|nr:winged helix-turn-helix transcriptional regulator [Bacteroidales bacterium]
MGKTIDIIKKKREVPQEVKDNIKAFTKIKKQILKTLETEPKSVPQIAKEIDLAQDIVTYHLMTLQKFGSVEVDDIDDMDEYYLYKLKK